MLVGHLQGLAQLKHSYASIPQTQHLSPRCVWLEAITQGVSKKKKGVASGQLLVWNILMSFCKPPSLVRIHVATLLCWTFQHMEEDIWSRQRLSSLLALLARLLLLWHKHRPGASPEEPTVTHSVSSQDVSANRTAQCEHRNRELWFHISDDSLLQSQVEFNYNIFKVSQCMPRFNLWLIWYMS